MVNEKFASVNDLNEVRLQSVFREILLAEYRQKTKNPEGGYVSGCFHEFLNTNDWRDFGS